MTLDKIHEEILRDLMKPVNVSKDFTVLGLLGPAGSGKDLVADWLVEKKGFLKVAFVDPMKRFVFDAFGIGWDHLWGPSEKRDEMFDIPDIWWYEAIGHFGDAAKEIVQEVLPEGLRVSGYMKLHAWLTNLRKEYPNRISSRLILQTLGTEWGRSVDSMMWANYAYRVIDKLRRQEEVLSYTPRDGLRASRSTLREPLAGVVIPDHRFINEVEYTKTQGGYVLRLRRLAKETIEPVGITGHQSEAEQKGLTDDVFDHVFNFGEGVDKVHEALEGAYDHRLWIDTRKSRS